MKTSGPPRSGDSNSTRAGIRALASPCRIDRSSTWISEKRDASRRRSLKTATVAIATAALATWWSPSMPTASC